MTGGRSGPAWQSSDELLVLHAVRLAGFADTEAITDRVVPAVGDVGATLRALERQHLVERMTFADAGGWILTEAGKSRDAQWLQDELAASGAGPVLRATSEDFEIVNARLVRTVTEWQLQSSADRADNSAAVVRELADAAEVLSDLMADLARRLPRFGRYPRQFTGAVEKARAGDDAWVAGVGMLSCHTVWAELHQDLLSTLGRDRSADPRQGGV